jgi:hypothetical protein
MLFGFLASLVERREDELIFILDLPGAADGS